MIFLTLEELLVVAERALQGQPVVRDYGLLESALARPATTLFGKDAYPGLSEKAAALMHSLVGNHALVDGNERLCLAGTIAFAGLNGYRLSLTNDEAYTLVMDIAKSEITQVADIAPRLNLVPRRRS